MKIKSFRTLLLIISIVVIKPITSNESDIYCFVGDAGEVNPTQAMVVEALANSDCSMVWHLGDITQLGVQSINDPELQDSFLTPFKPFLETEIPFYLTVGNHDYKGDPTVYLEVAKDYPSIHHPSNFYTKQFGKLCFFALDTTIFDKLYYFYKRGSQIRWLAEEVERMKDQCEFSIAVAHHPLFSSGDRDRANPQLAIFLENYVFGTFDIYITGHNHVLADEGDHKKTLQLISATGALPGGSPLEIDKGKFNIETPGYLRMTIDGNTARYEFISAEDDEILWSNIKVGSGLR
ncbi:metallophosphoesterase [Gammaproteobacteria bacterium]|nr:metallophosphoesterase [Gammaproteobacteria bacterium]MDC0577011.1 metallophosphoesterase [Gammaproteobacteria bacterium]MDC0865317.1 metallophosphoesterase [bacterium]